MSAYREAQRKKAIDLRDDLFKDSGNGMFSGKKYVFVLNNPILNLWEGIRKIFVMRFSKYLRKNGKIAVGSSMRRC